MKVSIKSSVLTDETHIKVQVYLEQYNMSIKVIEFKTCTKTSDLAAQALGVEVAQIAKTLVFLADNEAVLVVTCGDMKVDQKKLKKLLVAKKVKFADPDKVLEITGYPVGGVCPFNLIQPVRILLDRSMARFELVYAAAGTSSSAVPVTLEQLQIITKGEIVEVG